MSESASERRLDQLVRPCFVTTTTDGRTHIAVFDREGRHTAAEEHITIAPDGSVEYRWPNVASPALPVGEAPPSNTLHVQPGREAGGL